MPCCGSAMLSHNVRAPCHAMLRPAVPGAASPKNLRRSQLTNSPRMPRRSPPSLPITTAVGQTGMAAMYSLVKPHNKCATALHRTCHKRGHPRGRISP